MRLIDADELIPLVIARGFYFSVETNILNLIDNAPTVSFAISPDYVTELQNLNRELIKQLEEAERPQGEWISDYRICKCSVCNFTTVIDTYNFCPNCGADMRQAKVDSF